jgi:hypothetical protein
VNVWDTFTGSAFLEPVRLVREEHQSFQLRGHFPHSDTQAISLFVGGSKLNPTPALIEESGLPDADSYRAAQRTIELHRVREYQDQQRDNDRRTDDYCI